MRERDSDGYPAIDVFRLVSAFFVVAIHTSPLAELTPTGDFVLTSVIARLAVPFFFMTSGFFTVTRYAKDAKALWSFEKRTVTVYAAATLIYLPVNIRNGYFKGPWLLPEIIRDILFDGTFYHLWYLPAAAIGAAVAWALIRKADYPWAFAVTGALYLVGLLGDSWFKAAEPVMGGFYGLVFQLMDRTRGGIFMAPIFFVLGAYMKDARIRLPWPLSALGFTLTLAIMTGEALELRALGWARFYTVYLTLPACAFFLFGLLLRIRGRRVRWARSAALIVYIIHPMAIIAARAMARPLGLWGPLVESGPGHFLAVSLITALVAIPLALMLPRHKAGDTLRGRAWRELDTDALEHNVNVLRQIMPSGCELMAVVKANAYGHGEFETARELEKMGVRAWAVATADEGAELRKYGVHGEILVLGYSDPGRARELHRLRLTQTVVSSEYAGRLAQTGVRLRVHIKIDTGMHRLGISWDDAEAIAGVFAHKNLIVTGMYTHLALSELRDNTAYDYTREQRRRFREAVTDLETRGIKAPPAHIQSTYGLLNYPELSEGYVRVGLGIYGVLSAPNESTVLTPDLRPALSVKARVALVRAVPEGEGVGYGGKYRAPGPRKIAILPIGYADGFPRQLSGGKGYVLLRGRRAPVAGAVCMDQMAVDVTDIPDAAPGDVATVIGRDGDEILTAPELAEMSGTITNELLSRLGPRLPVVVRGN